MRVPVVRNMIKFRYHEIGILGIVELIKYLMIEDRMINKMKIMDVIGSFIYSEILEIRLSNDFYPIWYVYWSIDLFTMDQTGNDGYLTWTKYSNVL